MRKNELSKISDDINTLTPYEKKQNRNFLTKWLSTFRYRKLIKLTRELSREIDGVITVCEIGAASGKLYSVLNSVCDIDYVGLEYRQDRVDIANERFGEQDNFKISCGKIEENLPIVGSCDLVVA